MFFWKGSNGICITLFSGIPMERNDITKIELPSSKWVMIQLKKPLCGRISWNIASSLTLLTIGLFSKFLISVANKSTVYNGDKFQSILAQKPPSVPLITVSNHHSCFDDPGIWGALDVATLSRRDRMRWALAAHDVCFTNKVHSYFFMLGKCVPIVRGLGVHQDAMNFMLEQLGKGDWVHVFPEGRVNETKEYVRLKWGVGRLIYDSPVEPIVIPICHLGMDDILPNKKPYIFKIGKALTLNFGNPIDVGSLLQKLRKEAVSEKVARKVITDKIQDELVILKKQTEALHNKRFKKYSYHFIKSV